MQSKCRSLDALQVGLPQRLLLLETRALAKGCGEVAASCAETTTAAGVPRMTQSVRFRREGNRTLADAHRTVGRGAVLSAVNFGDVDQHDRDVVLNRVNAPAGAAFQTLTVPIRNYRLLANRAHQHIKQILRNHNHCIVPRAWYLHGAAEWAGAKIPPQLEEVGRSWLKWAEVGGSCAPLGRPQGDPQAGWSKTGEVLGGTKAGRGRTSRKRPRCTARFAMR
jgi:hypothetical protein